MHAQPRPFSTREAHQEEVFVALEYLLERQDRAPGAAFAVHMAKSDRRVVSHLANMLNVDGYEVLGYERKSKRVALDRELLVHSFRL